MFSTEDRIRQLCEDVLAAPNDVALEKALCELKAAIQIHIYKIRVLAAAEIPRAFRSPKQVA